MNSSRLVKVALHPVGSAGTESALMEYNLTFIGSFV